MATPPLPAATPSLAAGLEALKKKICFGGTRGVLYLDAATQQGLSPAVALYLAKRFLSKLGFVFKNKGAVIAIVGLDSLPSDAVCAAPMHLISEFLGMQHFEDAIHTPNDELTVLEALGHEQDRGLTAVEFTQKMGKGVCTPALDRLVIRGCIIKRLLMPARAVGSKPRTQASVTLFHLKRCARFYQPDADHCQIFPSDVVREHVFQYLRNLLDREQVSQITSRDLCPLLQCNKRTIQYLRIQVLSQVKTDPACPIDFVERMTRCMRMRSGNGLGKVIKVWCLVRNSNAKILEADMMYKIRNLSTYDQLEHYILQYNGIVSSEIRRYVSAGRKRAIKMTTDLTTRLGFPTIKVQEGKQLVYKLMPKAWNADSTGNNLDADDSSALDAVNPDAAKITPIEPKIEGVAAETVEGSARTPAPKAKMSSKAKMPAKSPAKTPAKALLTTPINADEVSIGEESSSLQKFKLSRTMRDFVAVVPVLSLEQEEKTAVILEYINSQPCRVGSVLEASQRIRKKSKDQGNTYYVCKKTINRTVQGMIQRGLIDTLEVPIAEEDRSRFDNFSVVQLLHLAGDREDLDSRVQECIDTHNYSRKRFCTTSRVADADSAMDVADSDEDGRGEDADSASAVGATPQGKKSPAGKKKRVKPTDEPDSGEHEAGDSAVNLPAKRTRVSTTPKTIKATKTSKAAATAMDEDMDNLDDTAAAAAITCFRDDPTFLLRSPPGPSERGGAGVGASSWPVFDIPDDVQEDCVLWGDRKRKNADQSAVVVPTTPALADGEWTLDEDITLLEMFLQHLVVRRARLGLPALLKPIKKLKRSPGAKFHFAVFPEHSCLRIQWQDLHLSTLRNYYLVNCCLPVGAHTVSGARRRLQIIVRNFSTLRSLLATVLWHQRERLHPTSLRAVNHVLAAKSAVSLTEADDTWALCAVLKFLGNRMFTVADIVPDLDTKRVRALLRVLRELYMHGMIKRSGHDEEIDHVLETKFLFSPVYMTHVLDNPFGGLFDELLHEDRTVEQLRSPMAGLDAEQQTMRSFLMLSHQLCLHHRQFVGASSSSAAHTLAVTSATVQLQMKGRGSSGSGSDGGDDEEAGAELEDNAMDAKPLPMSEFAPFTAPSITSPGGAWLAYACCTSTESGPVGRALDRLAVHIATPCTLPQLFSTQDVLAQVQARGGWDQPELSLPWLNCADRSVRLPVLHHLTNMVLTYLGDHCGASVTSIHSAMMVLPAHVLKELLALMVGLSLIRTVDVHHSQRLRSPFDSAAFWTRTHGAVQQQKSVYYEVALC